jgi:hypothetical protein
MKLISVEDLIEELNKQNIDLGKGDPYNRLRYYTKMGWIPHMIRKKNSKNVISGHYEEGVLDLIKEIEVLKDENKTNEDISKHLKKNKIIASLVSQKSMLGFNNSNQFYSRLIYNFLNLFENFKKRFSTTALLLSILLVSFLIDLYFFRNKDNTLKNEFKNDLQNNVLTDDKTIFPSGESFFPKGQSKVFVSFSEVKSDSKIFITFYENIFPASFYFISEIKEGQGFYVETNIGVSEEAMFSWIIAK